MSWGPKISNTPDIQRRCIIVYTDKDSTGLIKNQKLCQKISLKFVKIGNQRHIE